MTAPSAAAKTAAASNSPSVDRLLTLNVTLVMLPPELACKPRPSLEFRGERSEVNAPAHPA
jgi:hypothetical protein